MIHFVLSLGIYCLVCLGQNHLESGNEHSLNTRRDIAWGCRYRERKALDLRIRPVEKMGRAKNKRKDDSEQQSGVASVTNRSVKRAKRDNKPSVGALSHPLLSQLHPHLQTLREYILARLPASSRLRRKKIASVGLQSEASERSVTEVKLALARLLDTTVVAYSAQRGVQHDDRWEKWNSFSQKGDDSHVTLSDGHVGSSFCQTEV